MLWESLVSDGHVRAARLRRLQPWFVGSGLLLIWVGAWVASLAPGTRPEASVASIVQQRLAKAQTRAEAAVTPLQRPTLGASELAALPPVAELSEVIDAVLHSLDRSGELPTDTFTFTETERDALWKGDWHSEQLHYLKAGDLYVVAANVNVGQPTRAQAARWIGVFKKFGDKWQYGSLQGPGLYQPRPYPSLRARDIPLSLAPLLPDER
ncbi:MAG: hypothetical protein KF788_18635 [Piscinibacter sp.]|nr:hypothetical protein [Piscinibacter sp.]